MAELVGKEEKALKAQKGNILQTHCPHIATHVYIQNLYNFCNLGLWVYFFGFKSCNSQNRLLYKLVKETVK